MVLTSSCPLSASERGVSGNDALVDLSGIKVLVLLFTVCFVHETRMASQSPVAGCEKYELYKIAREFRMLERFQAWFLVSSSFRAPLDNILRSLHVEIPMHGPLRLVNLR